MKNINWKTIPVILLMLSMSFGVLADGHKFIVGPPEFLLTVGTSFHNSEQGTAGTSNVVTLSVQSRTCYRSYVCYNPVFAHIKSERKSEHSDNNTGLGVDFKFKIPKVKNNGYFLSVGPVVFGDRLNGGAGSHLNYHVGIGMELRRVVVSVDMYGNPFDSNDGEPLQTVNVGYRF